MKTLLAALLVVLLTGIQVYAQNSASASVSVTIHNAAWVQQGADGGVESSGGKDGQYQTAQDGGTVTIIME